jgi:hypothetical protein
MEQRKLPIKTRDIELTGDYEGWHFTARTNPPMRVLTDLSSGDLNLITEALGGVIVDWNFVDEEGKAMANPSPEAVRELPVDLAMEVARSFSVEVGKLGGN